MKPAIRLTLPPFAASFRGRHPSPMAAAARRRGNAAGIHGPARYGAPERRARRREERAARLDPHGTW